MKQWLLCLSLKFDCGTNCTAKLRYTVNWFHWCLQPVLNFQSQALLFIVIVQVILLLSDLCFKILCDMKQNTWKIRPRDLPKIVMEDHLEIEEMKQNEVRVEIKGNTTMELDCKTNGKEAWCLITLTKVRKERDINQCTSSYRLVLFSLHLSLIFLLNRVNATETKKETKRCSV